MPQGIRALSVWLRAPCRASPGLLLTAASLLLFCLPAKPPVYGPCRLLDIELEMVSRAPVHYCHGLYVNVMAGCWGVLPGPVGERRQADGGASHSSSRGLGDAWQVEEKGWGPSSKAVSSSVLGFLLNSIQKRDVWALPSRPPGPAKHSQGAHCLLLPCDSAGGAPELASRPTHRAGHRDHGLLSGQREGCAGRYVGPCRGTDGAGGRKAESPSVETAVGNTGDGAWILVTFPLSWGPWALFLNLDENCANVDETVTDQISDSVFSDVVADSVLVD